mgnify:CR=1 FL=1
MPIVPEYVAVQKAGQKAAYAATSVTVLRAAVDRSASMDDIRSINGKDLEVSKNGDRFTVHYEYEREIGLAGPAYLVYRFNGSTK